jgi:hypothetical protein
MGQNQLLAKKKNMLLWHLWCFLVFFTCSSLYKLEKVLCKFTDGEEKSFGHSDTTTNHNLADRSDSQ